MGYTMIWHGKLAINPPLPQAVTQYLTRFFERRHVLMSPKHQEHGAFEVDYLPPDEEDKAALDIVDWNRPPPSQPFIWCDWEIDALGSSLTIRRPRNYRSIEWLEYIIWKFISPYHSVVSGTMTWRGEEVGDEGCLYVDGNIITRWFTEPSIHRGFAGKLVNPYMETYLAMEAKLVQAFDPNTIMHDRTGVEGYLCGLGKKPSLGTQIQSKDVELRRRSMAQ
jgi:hypothetical protein